MLMVVACWKVNSYLCPDNIGNTSFCGPDREMSAEKKKKLLSKNVATISMSLPVKFWCVWHMKFS